MTFPFFLLNASMIVAFGNVSAPHDNNLTIYSTNSINVKPQFFSLLFFVWPTESKKENILNYVNPDLLIIVKEHNDIKNKTGNYRE